MERNGSKRHSHSGLAAHRPHSLDLGPVDHNTVQNKQVATEQTDGVPSLKPGIPYIAKSIEEVREFRSMHGVKPPVQQRF